MVVTISKAVNQVLKTALFSFHNTQDKDGRWVQQVILMKNIL